MISGYHQIKKKGNYLTAFVEKDGDLKDIIHKMPR